MIALMVLGTFVAIVGVVASPRGRGPRGVGRFIAALIVAFVAGLVLGFVDLHSDDTRPGLEILVAVVAPLLVFTLPAGIAMAAPARKPQPAAAPADDGPIEWQPRASKPATERERRGHRVTTASAQPAPRLRAARRRRLQRTPRADPGRAVMRLVAMLVAAIAALGSSYGALAAMRAVGPDDQTDVFGYGDAATVSPGGGDLLESKNFARVVTALRARARPRRPARLARSSSARRRGPWRSPAAAWSMSTSMPPGAPNRGPGTPPVRRR